MCLCALRAVQPGAGRKNASSPETRPVADSDPALANAVTIEAPRRKFRRPKLSDHVDESARRRVALVEGSTPHMSSETRSLLRTRLRIVSVLLGIGFTAFMFWMLAQRAINGDW